MGDDVFDFSRVDVMRHLAELGYSNVSETKVDGFMTDLKRLIKYEEKRLRVGEKLEQLEIKTKVEVEKDQSRKRQVRGSVAPDSSTSPEVIGSSRPRRVRRADKLLRSKAVEEEETTVTRDVSDHPASSTDNSSLFVSVDLDEEDSVRSSALPRAVSLLDTGAGPGGFIRVRSGPNRGRRSGKTDPVTLHQQYRAAWAKTNIPGEKSHKQLRWAVRGWMMGEEPL